MALTILIEFYSAQDITGGMEYVASLATVSVQARPCGVALADLASFYPSDTASDGLPQPSEALPTLQAVHTTATLKARSATPKARAAVHSSTHIR